MARRSGFDEVEISDDLAARKPEDEWQFRANWQAHDYTLGCSWLAQVQKHETCPV